MKANGEQIDKTGKNVGASGSGRPFIGVEVPGIKLGSGDRRLDHW